jgi:hypothetical protein
VFRSRNKFRFLETEIQVGLTFARLALADSSTGRRATGERVLAKAQQAHHTVLRYSPKAQVTADDRRILHGNIHALRQVIELVSGTDNNRLP